MAALFDRGDAKPICGSISAAATKFFKVSLKVNVSELIKITARSESLEIFNALFTLFTLSKEWKH